MNIRSRYQNAILFFLIYGAGLLILHCHNTSNVKSAQQHAVISGKIDSRIMTNLSRNFASGDDGVQVVLTQMKHDGSIVLLSHHPVTPDQNGNFHLTMASDIEKDAIVVVSAVNSEWKTTVDKKIHTGDSVTIGQITDETTVETNVYNRLRMMNDSVNVTFHDVQQLIDPTLASSVRGNASRIATVAEAILSIDNIADPHQGSGLPVRNALEVLQPSEKTNHLSNTAMAVVEIGKSQNSIQALLMAQKSAYTMQIKNFSTQNSRIV